MPVQKCTKDGQSGWQWGNQTCYTGPGAKKKAIKQGVAIEISKHNKGKANELDSLNTQLVAIELTEQNPAYGYCPFCKEVGMERERRLNGNDICINEHIYPSKDALHDI